MKANVTFETANEQHVRNYTIFGNPTDSKLYYDITAEQLEQVTEEDLKKLFTTGKLIIVVTADETVTLYRPVAVTGNVAKTVDVASSTVTVTEWAALASA